MTDYRQEMVPPRYRNLVLNPSGEATSLGATYTASNGQVLTGVSGGAAPAASNGTAVVQYEVLDNTSLSYYFAPLGPVEPVHRGGFKIPNAGTVSARVKLRASAACWVQFHASWHTEIWTDNLPAGLSAPISITPISTAVQLGTVSWTTLAAFVATVDVPEGATHWRPLVTVYSSNPATTPNPPAIGLKVWADEFFVLDSGLDTTGITYGDGDTPGWNWEGDPRYSSSVVSIEPEVEPPASIGEPLGIDTTEDESSEPPISTETAASPQSPERPVVPDANLDDEGVRGAGARNYAAEAEDVITWRNGSRRVCLRADIELNGLILNTIDPAGTVWICSDLEGWWTTPESDVPDVPKAWFDGSFETRGRYTARIVNLTGSFFPRSPAAVAEARDRLIRAADLVHEGGWLLARENYMNDSLLTKGAKVWLVGAPLITTVNQSGRTDFSIPLRAPDSLKHSIKNGIPPGYDSIEIITSGSEFPEREYPRAYPWKYPDAVFGSTVAIVQNIGNKTTWPILRMAGPTNGAVKLYNIDTNQEFRITRQLYPGEVLEIDCLTRQVTLNGEGNYRFYLDVDVDWLMLQPGPNKLFFVEEVLGSIRTKMEILWRSSWIG